MNLPRLALAALLAAASLSVQAVGRLADITVHDRATGRDLPVHWHQGRAYVVGRPGNEYEVVVRNRAGEDLLAVVSVDGVNVLSGETAGAQQGGYVVRHGERLPIRGWRKSLGEVASFYFTSLGDSYAGRTGRPGHVGVIGVALFQRGQPPRAEAADAAEATPKDHGDRMKRERQSTAPLASAAPLGTGHGRRESSHARYVTFERRTAEPVETLALYYDSHRNLVAQGVLPSHARPRDPNPFPASFVPDP
jgi:hypothetical protein